MSTPTTIQGKLVPVMISTDGINYKNVVCKKVGNLNLDSPVNKEDTDCGSFSGLGAVNWTIDIEGLLNTTPNTATELSANEMLNFANNQTLVYIKILYAPYILRSGQGYISNYKETFETNALVGFTATFTNNGALATA